MADQDEIIRVLSHFPSNTFCAEGVDVTIADVLALLEAQKPMLLDFADIQTMHDVDVWCEFRNSARIHPLMLLGSENSNKRKEVYFLPGNVKSLKAYGKTWRCWTARPSDEQRKAVKWE